MFANWGKKCCGMWVINFISNLGQNMVCTFEFFFVLATGPRIHQPCCWSKCLTYNWSFTIKDFVWLNDDNISYPTIKSHIMIHAYVIAFLLKHILYIVQEETKNMANYASAILFLCVVAKNASSWYYSKICGTWYTYYACLYYSATIATLGCMI